MVVVVVVGRGQLGPPAGVAHASQQLVQVPTLPCVAVQCAASLLILHFVPAVVVRQHVTASGLPHVEQEAHFLTDLAQLLLTRIAFACCTAQLTYASWVDAPAQSQLAATAARALAMSDLSGSVVGSHSAWPGTALANSTRSAAGAATQKLRAGDAAMWIPFLSEEPAAPGVSAAGPPETRMNSEDAPGFHASIPTRHGRAPRAHAPARWRATRSESAMIVSVGLNPPADTNTEPSAT